MTMAPDSTASSQQPAKAGGSSFFSSLKSRSSSQTPSRNASSADIHAEQKSRPESKSSTAESAEPQNKHEPQLLDTRPITKTGHYGNLDIAQAKALSELRRILEREGFLPDKNMIDDEHRDTILLRFLRARDFNIVNALQMFADSQKWREEVGIEGMMKPASEGGFDFEERDKVAESGWKMYFHSTDKYHRPLFVQDLSQLNPTEVFTHTTPDRVINFFACMLEDAVRRRYRICTAVARERARTEGVEEERVRRLAVDDNFMILNIADLGMGTFWAFKGQLQQLLSILDLNFPELSGRVQIINAPWLFTTIWSYIKGWLPKNTVEKIDIVGADYQSALLEYIDAKDLPASMGGTCECEGKGCAWSDKGPWKDVESPKPNSLAPADEVAEKLEQAKLSRPEKEDSKENSAVGSLDSGLPAAAESSVDSKAPENVEGGNAETVGNAESTGERGEVREGVAIGNGKVAAEKKETGVES